MALNAINVLDLKMGIDQSPYRSTRFQGSLRVDVLRPTLDLILAPPPKILISRGSLSRGTMIRGRHTSREDETVFNEDSTNERQRIPMVRRLNVLIVIS